jgi:drug/metabolite transporter (DMT)-like permease
MAVCWGGTWPAGKLAVEDAPPATIAVVRFALATALLWLWARSRPAGRKPGRRDLPLVLAMGATAVAGYNLLFLYGLSLAPATDGAIVVPGLAPILTALLAWAILGNRIGVRAALGLAVALAGLVLVVDPSGGIEGRRLAGDLLFLAGAVCWGAYSLLGKVATDRFDTVTATLYGAGAGTLMLVPFSFADGGWAELAGAPADAWISIGYLAVFGTAVGFVLFYEGVKRIGPARATTFTFLVPVFGVLGAVLILGERPSVLTAIGGAIVLAGLWLVQRRPAARRREVAEPLRA